MRDSLVLARQIETLRDQLSARASDIFSPFEKEYLERRDNELDPYPIKTQYILDYIESQKASLEAKKEKLLADLKLWGGVLFEMNRIYGEPQYVDKEGMVEDFKEDLKYFGNRLEREVNGLEWDLADE